jgi:FKBP-type peptidyl-prolyl cis-trans isomerase
MMRFFFAVAALTLAACGNNDGVMDEINRAEDQQAAVSRAVTEEAQTLPSGLVLQFTQRAVNENAPQPTINAMARVHYQGTFVDGGEEFDSSFGGEPVEFPLGAVVQGFSEAITHMRPGDEVIATFPGSLGYGPEGRGPIPPNAALRFRIQLIAFQEPGGPWVQATAP